MPRLSNFLWSHNREPGDDPIICRPVEHAEIDPALRILLSNAQGPADDHSVLEFLAFAVERKIDLNDMWIALADNQICWTLLPINSPGLTMLLFTPAHIPRAISIEAAKKLTSAVCDYWHQNHAVQLAQLLIDPRDAIISDLYLSCGFEKLAELIYLQRNVRDESPPALPAGFALVNYDSSTHADFAAAILQTYQGSLDCPLLNGRREIENVIAGHKATGIFDPTLWFLLTEAGQSRGVLILSPSQYIDAVELVYLGLAPAGRRRGLGDFMMQLAMNSVIQKQRGSLSLAVDSENSPAMKLYFRHGLKRIGARLALMRDLRTGPQTKPV